MAILNTKALLQEITRDPNYVQNYTYEAPPTRTWDGRHHLGKLPPYDAFKDRYCKWSKKKKSAATVDFANPGMEKLLPLSATYTGPQSQTQLGNMVGSWPTRPAVDSSKIPVMPLNAWATPPLHTMEKLSSDPQPPNIPRTQNVPPKHIIPAEDGLQKFLTAGDLRRPKMGKAAIQMQNAISSAVPSLHQLFAKSQQTITDLWDRLGIAQEDRQQFSAVAFAEVTTDNLKMINDEIQRLLDRRNASVQVEKNIEIREGFLYLLQELAERSVNSGPNDRDKLLKEVTPLIVSFRTASLDVVESIMKWREIVLNPSAIYYWKGVSYLMKMQEDLTFLGYSKVAGVLDFPVLNNPFLYPGHTTRAENMEKMNTHVRNENEDIAVPEQLHHAEGGLVLPGTKRRMKFAQLMQTRQAVDTYTPSANPVTPSRSLPPVKPKVRGDISSADPFHHRVIAAERVLRDEVRLLSMLNSTKKPRGSKTTTLMHPSERSKVNDSDDVPEEIEPEFEQPPTARDDNIEEEDWLTTNLNRQRALENRAATNIQRMWRGFLDRREVDTRREHKRAATVIQKLARQYLARKDMLRRQKQYRAARKIQALARGMLARILVANIHLRQASALKIQSAWRGHLGRVRAKHIANQFAAARDIQRVWKGYITRTRLKLREFAKNTNASIAIQKLWRGCRVRMRPQYNVRKVKATVKIQSFFRVLLARKKVAQIRRRRKAAVKIQAWMRGIFARKLALFKKHVQLEDKFQTFLDLVNKSAINIQRVWKGYVVRKQTSDILNTKRLSAATVSIQKTYRGFIARRDLNKDQQAMAKHAASIRIQSAVRVWLAKRELVRRRSMHEAAVTIQRIARGYKIRNDTPNLKVEQAEKERRSLWEAQMALCRDNQSQSIDTYKSNKSGHRSVSRPDVKTLSRREAACIIQRTIRVALAKMKVKAKRKARFQHTTKVGYTSLEQEQEAAAVLIQSSYRGMATRNKVSPKRSEPTKASNSTSTYGMSPEGPSRNLDPSSSLSPSKVFLVASPIHSSTKSTADESPLGTLFRASPEKLSAITTLQQATIYSSIQPTPFPIETIPSTAFPLLDSLKSQKPLISLWTLQYAANTITPSKQKHLSKIEPKSEIVQAFIVSKPLEFNNLNKLFAVSDVLSVPFKGLDWIKSITTNSKVPSGSKSISKNALNAVFSLVHTLDLKLRGIGWLERVCKSTSRNYDSLSKLFEASGHNMSGLEILKETVQTNKISGDISPLSKLIMSSPSKLRGLKLLQESTKLPLRSDESTRVDKKPSPPPLDNSLINDPTPALQFATLDRILQTYNNTSLPQGLKALQYAIAMQPTVNKVDTQKSEDNSAPINALIRASRTGSTPLLGLLALQRVGSNSFSPSNSKSPQQQNNTQSALDSLMKIAGPQSQLGGLSALQRASQQQQQQQPQKSAPSPNKQNTSTPPSPTTPNQKPTQFPGLAGLFMCSPLNIHQAGLTALKSAAGMTSGTLRRLSQMIKPPVQRPHSAVSKTKSVVELLGLDIDDSMEGLDALRQASRRQTGKLFPVLDSLMDQMPIQSNSLTALQEAMITTNNLVMKGSLGIDKNHRPRSSSSVPKTSSSSPSAPVSKPKKQEIPKEPTQSNSTVQYSGLNLLMKSKDGDLKGLEKLVAAKDEGQSKPFYGISTLLKADQFGGEGINALRKITSQKSANETTTDQSRNGFQDVPIPKIRTKETPALNLLLTLPPTFNSPVMNALRQVVQLNSHATPTSLLANVGGPHLKGLAVLQRASRHQEPSQPIKLLVSAGDANLKGLALLAQASSKPKNSEITQSPSYPQVPPQTQNYKSNVVMLINNVPNSEQYPNLLTLAQTYDFPNEQKKHEERRPLESLLSISGNLPGISALRAALNNQSAPVPKPNEDTSALSKLLLVSDADLSYLNTLKKFMDQPQAPINPTQLLFQSADNLSSLKGLQVLKRAREGDMGNQKAKPVTSSKVLMVDKLLNASTSSSVLGLSTWKKALEPQKVFKNIDSLILASKGPEKLHLLKLAVLPPDQIKSAISRLPSAKKQVKEDSKNQQNLTTVNKDIPFYNLSKVLQLQYLEQRPFQGLQHISHLVNHQYDKVNSNSMNNLSKVLQLQWQPNTHKMYGLRLLNRSLNPTIKVHTHSLEKLFAIANPSNQRGLSMLKKASGIPEHRIVYWDVNDPNWKELKSDVDSKCRIDEERIRQAEERAWQDKDLLRQMRINKQAEEEAEKAQAAIAIQAAFRGASVRMEVQKEKKRTESMTAKAAIEEQKRQEQSAAGKIERTWLNTGKPNITNRKSEAAIKIQSLWRCIAARERVRRRRIARNDVRHKLQEKEEREFSAALKIQCAWRQMIARVRVRHLKALRRYQTIQPNVETIQRATRVSQAKNTASEIRSVREQELEKEKEKDRRQEAAMKIQMAWKCSRARTELAHREYLAIEKRKAKLGLACALRIQCSWRAKLARDRVKGIKREQRKLIESRKALEFKQEMHEAMMNKEIKNIQENNNLLAKQNAAAATIQRAYRCYNARFKVYWKRKERDEKRARTIQNEGLDIESQAAIKIQGHTRGMLARKDVKSLNEKRIEERRREQEEDDRRNNAAALIQRGYKSYNARFEADWRREKKEEKQKRMEESKRVAERREPQPEPEPTMDNRDESEAALKIQQGWRGYNSRFEASWRREEKEKKKSNSKPSTPMTHTNLPEPPIWSEEKLRKRHSAAVKIQSIWRRALAIVKVKRMKARAKAELSALLEKEKLEMGASKLQASWRGFQTRRKSKSEFSDSPLWSETSERREIPKGSNVKPNGSIPSEKREPKTREESEAIVRVKVIQGKGWKNKELFGKSDPYCVLEMNKQKYRTKAFKGQGIATWDDIIVFNTTPLPLPELRVSVLDEDIEKDNTLATGSLNMSSYPLSEINQVAIPLQPSGELILQIAITPN